MDDQYEERDDAETPKEFYSGVQSRGILGLPQEADPEIEKLLWEEEVIEYSESHGERIRNLFLFGATRAEIAEALNIPLNVADEIVERAKLQQTVQQLNELGDGTQKSYTELGGTIYEDGELSAFRRTVLRYENLRPIKKDLIMLVIASVIFTFIMILINTLM